MRLFVDQLTNLDFSYLDAHRGLVGETWLANIELHGALDEQGMVCDFGKVKKMIRHWLDTNIDHKLVIPANSKQLTYSRDDDGQETIEWRCDRGVIKGASPSEAHCLVDADTIDATSVAQWATAQLKPLFPESVQRLELSFSVERIEGPYYHYSHGLKKHDGNCQRIAHGHRSKIEIWQNNAVAKEAMQAWAHRFKDIYVGSEEDCAQDADIAENYLFSYVAHQGAFRLSLPKSACYLISSDTTVELIAKHIADMTAKTSKMATTVKAYEGIAKGAISEA